MADKSDQDAHNESKPSSDANASFTVHVWPPDWRTRHAVVKSLVEIISSPSLLSMHYGSIPATVVPAKVRVIEEDAFNAANGIFNKPRGSAERSEAVEIEVLKHYSEDITRKIFELAKSAEARQGTSSSE
ncbi:hypothetical protein H6P81_009426 [Aristolochia fimbriata]|uniref:WPP domain-containing protein n=1 Tax=Aristolochia fimbriata TaxID=158543 RepID=A0AAV7EP18_ARIFI|nr:hypothetical protein H6P81_009426 [Aristolochia fimbriata]